MTAADNFCGRVIFGILGMFERVYKFKTPRGVQLLLLLLFASCCLLVGDILMMKIGLAPGNSMHLITGSNLTILMTPSPFKLLSLLPSVRDLGVEKGGRENNPIM